MVGQKTEDRRPRIILSPESLVLCPTKRIPRPAKKVINLDNSKGS